MLPLSSEGCGLNLGFMQRLAVHVSYRLIGCEPRISLQYGLADVWQLLESLGEVGRLDGDWRADEGVDFTGCDGITPGDGGCGNAIQ